MTSALIKHVKETFSDVKGLNIGKVKALIEETVKELRTLQAQMASTNPQEKEAALNSALALKQALEEQARNLSQSLQMNPEQLASFTENPNHFSDEEWQMFDSMKESLSELKNPAASDPKTPKKKSARKSWIAG